MLRRSIDIILRSPRTDDAPSPTKEDQAHLNSQGRLSHSSKSKVTPSNPMKTITVASKSKISKGKDMQVDKEVKYSSLTPKTATTTTSEATDIAHKRKKPSSSSGKDAEKSVGVVPFCSGLREVNIIDLSPLEILLEDVFKKCGDYDVARLSTSLKITRNSHQEFLSAAQHFLHTANEDKIKVDKHLGELQKILARVEKELEVWTSKKKKTLSLIEEHQKKMSKNQESIINSEDEVHAIKKINHCQKQNKKK
ncbi:hypothetical protein HAX54_020046 [Datura stramonium]|uniref:Uncharacterized protein n=1 Tax=Datura stramonium TaxID=4076 RepID=A0ABS8UT54_DATST|nr:hypothetical protein [Datura stramonium]